MKIQNSLPVFILRNEKGSILTITILILALLTAIGIAATRTSTIDTQIAGNELLYNQEFYKADAGISYFVGNPLTLDTLSPNSTPGSSNKFSIPAGLPFDLYYLSLLDAGSPKKVEIQSISPGGASVVAAFQYSPPAETVTGPISQGEY